MGKYKKPRQQTFKQANTMPQKNEIKEPEIFVEGLYHTNLTIQKIVEKTIQEYKQQLSENKWINSQKQKQHLIDYHLYSGSRDPATRSRDPATRSRVQDLSFSLSIADL